MTRLGGTMACSTGVKAALCCSIVGVTLVIILSVLMVIGQQTPISVHGSNAHLQEIRQVQSSLIAMDNRVNFSGIGLGSVLLLIILVIIARAGHHMAIKRPGKAVKRAIKAQVEARLVSLEDIMKARGFLP